MFKGNGLTKRAKKKRGVKKSWPFALPSYNLYFLPLMTGQTDLTIVAVVYVLGLELFKKSILSFISHFFAFYQNPNELPLVFVSFDQHSRRGTHGK